MAPRVRTETWKHGRFELRLVSHEREGSRAPYKAGDVSLGDHTESRLTTKLALGGVTFVVIAFSSTSPRFDSDSRYVDAVLPDGTKLDLYDEDHDEKYRRHEQKTHPVEPLLAHVSGATVEELASLVEALARADFPFEATKPRVG